MSLPVEPPEPVLTAKTLNLTVAPTFTPRSLFRVFHPPQTIPSLLTAKSIFQNNTMSRGPGPQDSSTTLMSPSLRTLLGTQATLPDDLDSDDESSNDENDVQPVATRRDPRTGLLLQSTTRHLALLRVLRAVPPGLNPWQWLIQVVRQEYPNPSSQRTLLSAALGAHKRQSTYNRFATQVIPAPGNVIQDRINALARTMRNTQDLDTPAATIADIRRVFHSAPTEEKWLLLLLVLTGHRGTSAADLLTRDVKIISKPPPWLELPAPPLQLEPPMTPQALSTIQRLSLARPERPLPCDERLLLVACRFRSGKTIGATGVYTIYLWLPVAFSDLLNAAGNQRYLFGTQRRALLRSLGTKIGIRSLRRATLRFLSWEGGRPAQDVLLFSRHTGPRQLATYLGGGMYSSAEAQTTTAMSHELYSALLLQ